MCHPNDKGKIYAVYCRIIVIAWFFVASMTAGCKNKSGIVESSLSPAVKSTVPADNTENVVVNTAISASFSHEMDPSSINDTTFMVFSDTVSIPGTISYDDSTATFIPENNLSSNSIITATITQSVTDLEGNSLDSEYEWSFTTEETSDNAPKIMATNPNPNANDVPVNTAVVATFNKPMDPATINTAAFMLEFESINIAGEVSYSETSAVFTPSGNLEYGQVYTAIIKSSIRDVEGNAMKEDYAWNFSTEKNDDLDTVSPKVSSTSPTEGASGVALSDKITATFTEAMNASTISESTFSVSEEGRSVNGTVTYSDNTATFTPDADLAYNTSYTATVSTGVEDTAGNPLETDYQWIFTTEEDRSSPSVVETIPRDDEKKVSSKIKITATFSEAMNPATISEETFLLQRRSFFNFLIDVSGKVSYTGRTATFTPERKLLEDTQYSVTITDQVTDRAGNSLDGSYSWGFETGDKDDDDEDDD